MLRVNISLTKAMFVDDNCVLYIRVSTTREHFYRNMSMYIRADGDRTTIHINDAAEN